MHLIDFIETFGDHSVYGVTSESLKEWLDHVQVENDLKEITMRGLKCQIGTFFNFLQERDIISESPLSVIYYEVQTRPLKSRNLLLPQEIRDLMKALKDYSPGYLYPILKLFEETAAKNFEIIELTWEQIDFVRNSVTFHKRDKVQGRTLKISDELVASLRLKFKEDHQRKQDKVFMTYYKEPFTHQKLRAAVNEFRKKGG